MGFGKLFAKSWKDYKGNFKVIALAMLVFYVIGFLIVKIVSFSIISSSGYNAALEAAIKSAFASGITADSVQAIAAVNVQYASALGQASIYSTIITVIAVLVYLIFVTGIVAVYLKKEKFSFKELYNLGKKHYWGCFGFIIVSTLLLLGLYILLIIPGIIFTVYWTIGIFSYLDDPNKGYVGSLKESYHLVKKRWWRTLGYLILFGIIAIVIYLVFNIPSFILSSINVVNMLKGDYSASFNAITEWVGFVMQMLANFVVVPLGIFFFRNMYIEYKKTKA